MTLVLDDDQILVRDTTLEFTRKRLPVSYLRKLRDDRQSTGHDAALWSEMAELGWTGMLIPEELGGNQFGYVALGLVMEALGRTLAPTPMLSTVVLSGSALAAAGAQALLPSIANGTSVFAFALEESAHHAPGSISTRAVRDGNRYLLSGRKRFVIDGTAADKLLVVARDEAAQPCLFLVDASAAGVQRQLLSLVDSRNYADIELANVAVPEDALLCSGGAATAVIEHTLDRGRILLAAEMLGMAQEAFDMTLAYLKQRTQFGVAIGSFQALKHRAVQMHAELEMSRSAVLGALNALDGNSPDVPRLASVCKARLNDTLMLVSNEAIQMHGGIGVTDEFDIGLYLKRARVAQATLGSSSFHRDRYATLAGF